MNLNIKTINNMVRYFIIFLLTEFFAFSAEANTATNNETVIRRKQSEEKMLEMRKLPEETLGKLSAYDVVITEYRALTELSASQIEMAVSFDLKKPFYSLLYDVNLWTVSTNDVHFVNSVKEVQRKFGEKVDGVITFSQYKRIVDISNQYCNSKKAFIPEDFKVVELGSGMVHAVGTLEIVGDKIAFPVNLHQMWANKDTMQCSDFSYSLVESNMMGESYYSVDLNRQNYDIISWSTEEIVCKQDYGERSEKVIIGLKSKAVTYIVTNREGAVSNLLGKLDVPRISRLVSGRSVVEKMDRNRAELIKKFLSDDAKHKLELFSAEPKP